MAHFNNDIFKRLRYIFFSCYLKFLAIYNTKSKIFINVEDDDNYDEEGGNHPEKSITPKECLEALEKV